MVWVDPSIGFCPRRIDYYAGEERYISTRISDYKELSAGVWFPMRQSADTESASKKRVWIARVLEASSNVALKESEMRVNFNTTKKVYVRQFE